MQIFLQCSDSQSLLHIAIILGLGMFLVSECSLPSQRRCRYCNCSEQKPRSACSNLPRWPVHLGPTVFFSNVWKIRHTCLYNIGASSRQSCLTSICKPGFLYIDLGCHLAVKVDTTYDQYYPQCPLSSQQLWVRDCVVDEWGHLTLNGFCSEDGGIPWGECCLERPYIRALRLQI